jgi:hypothetical protein
MPRNSSTVAVVHTEIAANASSSLASAYLGSGEPNSRVHYIKKQVKSTVFALASHPHSIQGGSANSWNTKATWKLGRQGDYLCAQWLRAEIGSVISALAANGAGARDRIIRWCRNLGHNLMSSIDLTFTGVSGASFDEFFLDFFSAFSVPAGKRNAYDNMIGNIPELVNPIVDCTGLATAVQVLPRAVLNVPLPLPYARDIGVSLPVGSLIYNEILLEIQIRNWSDLLVVSNTGTAAHGTDTLLAYGNSSRVATSADIVAAPTIALELWGKYVVVSSSERSRMGKLARDVVWEIVQTAASQGLATSSTDVDHALRYSYAVKALFFGVRNTTVANDRSNYTTREPLVRLAGALSTVEFPAPNAFDPISTVTLSYESSDRLSQMPVDFFSMIHPFYTSRVIPNITGYHVFSYSLDFVDVSPMGSVDFGKLTNINLRLSLSADARLAMTGGVIATASLPFYDEQGAASAFPPGYQAAGLTTAVVNGAAGFCAKPQTFQVQSLALAHSVIRFIGGAAGWPIF